MKKVLHKSNTRGAANHDWLKSYHTFSFANYYDPERMDFGTLRVINDDYIAPAKGFGTHPHDNMEIITIPLAGSLKHKDNMGNEYVIHSDDVQAMSAGTGVEHSEFNNSENEEVNLLQIWVRPKKINIKPSYSQKSFKSADRKNKLQLVVSPDGRENSVQINQDAFFSLTELEKGLTLNYTKYKPENGLYIFVIEGDLDLNGDLISKRDGIGIENLDNIVLSSQSKSKILIMEVPMKNIRRS